MNRDEDMTREAVQAELEEAGIDMAAAQEKLKGLLKRFHKYLEGGAVAGPNEEDRRQWGTKRVPPEETWPDPDWAGEYEWTGEWRKPVGEDAWLSYDGLVVNVGEPDCVLQKHDNGHRYIMSAITGKWSINDDDLWVVEQETAWRPRKLMCIELSNKAAHATVRAFQRADKFKGNTTARYYCSTLARHRKENKQWPSITLASHGRP